MSTQRRRSSSNGCAEGRKERLTRHVGGAEVAPVDVVRVVDRVEGEERPAVLEPEHVRRDVQLGRPGDEADQRLVLLGVAPVVVEVALEQPRRGHHVVVHEQHERRLGALHRGIAGGGTASRGAAHRLDRGEGREHLGGGVGGAVVHDHDLHRHVGALGGERLQAAAQLGGAVARGHHDGETLLRPVRHPTHPSLASHPAGSGAPSSRKAVIRPSRTIGVAAGSVRVQAASGLRLGSNAAPKITPSAE